MKKTTRISIVIFALCSLLSIFAVPAMAWDWPCPDDCYEWTGSDCILIGECGVGDPCPGGGYCIACMCMNCISDSDCEDCQECVNNDCVDCKCWDTGAAISGSITVLEAKICECVTHASNITDTDHWIDGSSNEGTPSDTISLYGWNATAGTWQDDTQAYFVWTAPECIGSVTITLNANDSPESMDNPCDGSTRDDDSNDFSDVSNVSLPTGCDECSGSPSISLDPGDYENDYTEDPTCCSDGICGCTGPAENVQTDISICYSGGKWKFGVSATADLPWGPCVSYFIEISNGNDSDLNENNYCEIVDCFDYDPEMESTGTGCCGVGNNTYSNKVCVNDHEASHVYDYVDNLEQEEINLASDPALSDVEINCNDPDTIDCADVLSLTEEAIEQAVKDAYDRASSSCDEEGAREVAQQCFYNLAVAICNVWDCDDCD